jgi:phage host-nuclease inhibitor protein Gam
MTRVSTFSQFIGEDINDPILMKLRASKHAEAERKQREQELKKLRVYGARRERMEEELAEILQQIQDLKRQQKELYREMEMEAGQRDEPYEPDQQNRIERLVALGLSDKSKERNPWTDADADLYGDQLNRLEDEIERLTQRAQSINDRLDY